MHIHRRVLTIFTYCLLFTGLLSSCYKKDIQAGSDLADSHTRIITVDTVGVILSSFVQDSFATSGNNFILLGNYKDGYLGNTTASTFFQPGFPTLPADVSSLLPKNAVYDSLMLYMRPSGYYYGDTTKPFSISVYELNTQPDYTYGNKLYNTSGFGTYPTPLATYSKRISPTRQDSVKIKLPDSKGADFFTRIQSKANQFLNETNFLDYFRGISIQPSNNDTGAVYGFNIGDSSVRMRLHYHLTIPVKSDQVIDFYCTRTSYQFNRVITDRSKTPLKPAVTGQHEFFAGNTNPYSFTQSGTGVLLKAKFPSLRDLLKINGVVRLMSAQLVLIPVKGAYDNYIYKLPNPLYMATTDITNNIGGSLADTTGSRVQYRSPSIDFLFGINTNYSFNVTSYVNMLLNTPGTAESGVFILQSDPTIAKQIDRGVFGSRQNATWQTKLVLTLLTID